MPSPFFLAGNVVVDGTLKLVLQRRQLMIMRGKKRFRADFFPKRILRNGARDAHTVEGARAAPDFVVDDEAGFRGVRENIGDLVHLQHKCGLPHREIVRSADAREYLIDDGDARLLSRHKRADLRHDADERDLPHIGGFSRHIGTGNQHKAIAFAVELRIIRDEKGILRALLDHRMPAVPDGNHIAVSHLGTTVAVAACHLGKRAIYIELRQHIRRFLNPVHIFRHLHADIAEELIFKRHTLLAGAEHLRFHILELLGDITFAVCQRLLADIPVRHLVYVGFGNLYVIAENAVIADLQRLDSRRLPARFPRFFSIQPRLFFSISVR